MFGEQRLSVDSEHAEELIKPTKMYYPLPSLNSQGLKKICGCVMVWRCKRLSKPHAQGFSRHNFVSQLLEEAQKQYSMGVELKTSLKSDY